MPACLTTYYPQIKEIRLSPDAKGMITVERAPLPSKGILPEAAGRRPSAETPRGKPS
ncbi:MAG: hypothetical protein JXQ73_09060 [Phycisphaerae bacterium]|nr:hypothetical protein [Phycisphaerae bacterium]